ncbi:hypothetical protein ACFSTI_24330 [Rhizorhabdus histidinilytica]
MLERQGDVRQSGEARQQRAGPQSHSKDQYGDPEQALGDRQVIAWLPLVGTGKGKSTKLASR